MEAPPPPPPPAAPPKKKPPQSTQPETAEDGQTLFDDELDRLLPVGTVASVMRAAIPQEAKIGRDAREAAQDCASEFVAFVASEASDACAAAGRRIMTGRDVVDVRSRRPVVYGSCGRRGGWEPNYVETPSRHRRDSCPSHNEGGGFFPDFELFRTASGPGRS